MKQNKIVQTKKPISKGIDKYATYFLLLILAIGFILYHRTLNYGYIGLDDGHYVYQNKSIQQISWENFKYIFTHDVIGMYNPLTFISYTIDFFFWGLNPKGYHLTNLLIHLLNSVLAFIVTKKIWRNRLVSLIVAFLFAIHPMHIESVAWIAERKDVLFACFYLLSIICYIDYLQSLKKIQLLIASLLFFILSVLSKPSAVTLALIIPLLDWFLGRKISKKLILEKVLFFLIAIVFGIITIKTHANYGDEITIKHSSYTIFDSIIFIAFSFVYYLKQFVFPTDFCLFHYYPIKNGNFLPYYYYFYLLICFIPIAIWKFLPQFRKVLLFGILFFVAALSIHIRIIPTGAFVVAERYAYIPYLGLYMIVAKGIFDLSYYQSLILKRLFYFLVVIFSFYLVFTHWNRLPVWQNSLTMANDIVEKNPQQAIAYYNRAGAHNYMGNYQAAISDYTTAIQLEPIYPKAYLNRGKSRAKINDFKGAIEDFEIVIQQEPNNKEVYYNYGLALNYISKFEEAISKFNKAIEQNPQWVDAYINRGGAYANIQKFDMAIKDFEKAISLNPQSGHAYHNLALVYYQLNDLNNACASIEKAISLGYAASFSLKRQFCK